MTKDIPSERGADSQPSWLNQEYLELISSVVDSPLCVIARFDASGRCTFVSKGCEIILAKNSSDVIDRCVWEIFDDPSPDGSACLKAFKTAITEGLREECTCSLFCRGVERTCLAIFSPEVLEAGKSSYVDVLIVDVSKCLNQQLKSPSPLLRRDKFLGIVAHELRNPLSALASALKILSTAPASPDAADVRQMMERQLTQLSRLVNDLLDMSRVNEAKFNLVKSPASLGEIVSLAIETTRSSIKKGNHQLCVHVPEEVIEFVVDSNRIAQVVSNLLDNAAKYTPSKGLITLRVVLEKEALVISVTDNGIGIAPEHKEDIFRQYMQVERVNSHSDGGLGLGLYLVKMIVEAHGGLIAVNSDGEGRGSEFVVRLPLEQK